jgi:hypothetical protein
MSKPIFRPQECAGRRPCATDARRGLRRGFTAAAAALFVKGAFAEARAVRAWRNGTRAAHRRRHQRDGHRLPTTRALIRGHEANLRDAVFREIRDARARETALTDFRLIPGSKLGELAPNFDVIFNRTLQEGDDGRVTAGAGKSEVGASGGRRAGFGPPPPFRIW